MLTSFTDEYLQVMRLVALLLLIPMDTSECERLFSLMNDLKTAERSNLDPQVLKNLMVWNYYGKNVSVEQLPTAQILQEWYKVCEGAGLRSVGTARAEESGSSGVRQSPTIDAGGSSGSGGGHGSSGEQRANQGSPSSDLGVDGLGAGGRFAWLGEGST